MKVLNTSKLLVRSPGGTVVKTPHANTGDTRDAISVPVLGRYPGVENVNLLQYSLPGEFHGQSGRLQLMGPHRVRHD